MKISTRGRYALRLMIELAMAQSGEYLSLKTIAERQDISEKYLEQIIRALSRAGFVRCQRGAKGGYKLERPAHEYTAGMILREIEGNMVPVACMADTPNQCARCTVCATLDFYERINQAVSGIIDHTTLADLALQQKEKSCGVKISGGNTHEQQ